MAYIAPNTDVYILRRVSLDKDYNHTVLQTSAANQANMFNNSTYKKYTLTAQSYQRAGENKIRVALLADNLYDCNYMMFRNTAFGSKWFYAFITKITYIQFYIPLAGDYIVNFTLPNGDEYYGEFTVTD